MTESWKILLNKYIKKNTLKKTAIITLFACVISLSCSKNSDQYEKVITKSSNNVDMDCPDEDIYGIYYKGNLVALCEPHTGATCGFTPEGIAYVYLQDYKNMPI